MHKIGVGVVEEEKEEEEGGLYLSHKAKNGFKNRFKSSGLL